MDSVGLRRRSTSSTSGTQLRKGDAKEEDKANGKFFKPEPKPDIPASSQQPKPARSEPPLSSSTQQHTAAGPHRYARSSRAAVELLDDDESSIEYASSDTSHVSAPLASEQQNPPREREPAPTATALSRAAVPLSEASISKSSSGTKSAPLQRQAPSQPEHEPERASAAVTELPPSQVLATALAESGIVSAQLSPELAIKFMNTLGFLLPALSEAGVVYAEEVFLMAFLDILSFKGIIQGIVAGVRQFLDFALQGSPQQIAAALVNRVKEKYHTKTNIRTILVATRLLLRAWLFAQVVNPEQVFDRVPCPAGSISSTETLAAFELILIKLCEIINVLDFDPDSLIPSNFRVHEAGGNLLLKVLAPDIVTSIYRRSYSTPENENNFEAISGDRTTYDDKSLIIDVTSPRNSHNHKNTTGMSVTSFDGQTRQYRVKVNVPLGAVLRAARQALSSNQNINITDNHLETTTELTIQNDRLSGASRTPAATGPRAPTTPPAPVQQESASAVLPAVGSAAATVAAVAAPPTVESAPSVVRDPNAGAAAENRQSFPAYEFELERLKLQIELEKLKQGNLEREIRLRELSAKSAEVPSAPPPSSSSSRPPETPVDWAKVPATEPEADWDSLAEGAWAATPSISRAAFSSPHPHHHNRSVATRDRPVSWANNALNAPPDHDPSANWASVAGPAPKRKKKPGKRKLDQLEGPPNPPPPPSAPQHYHHQQPPSHNPNPNKRPAHHNSSKQMPSSTATEYMHRVHYAPPQPTMAPTAPVAAAPQPQPKRTKKNKEINFDPAKHCYACFLRKSNVPKLWSSHTFANCLIVAAEIKKATNQQ